MKGQCAYIIVVLLCSCCQTNSKYLKQLDLATLNKATIVCEAENYDKYFENYQAVFLENTDSCFISDVKQIHGFEHNIYVLMNNRILCFDLSTGRVDKEFHFINENKWIASFDFDISQKRIYALDTKNSCLICFDTFGVILFEFPLDSQYKYDQVMVLDEEHLLLTAQSLPVPVTFIADLNNNQITSLDKPSKKSFTPDSFQLQQINSIQAPMFLWSVNDNGILLKYLLNDTVYQYSKDGKKPVFHVHSGRNGIAFKNKVNLFKKNKQLALSDFWQLPDNNWFLRFNDTLLNHRYQRFQICDSLLGPFRHFPPYNQVGLINWIKEGTIFYITNREIILFDERGRTLFTLQRYQPLDGESFNKNMINAKLPENLKNYPQKRDILLCYYVFNNVSGANLLKKQP